MELNLTKFHDLLCDNLNQSTTLSSISLVPIRDWFTLGFNKYRNCILANKQKNKKIRRISFIDFDKTSFSRNNFVCFENDLKEKLNSLINIYEKNSKLVDVIYNESYSVEYANKFYSSIKEIAQFNTDVLALFQKFHYPEEDACLAYDRNKTIMLADIGIEEFDELLIYDNIAIKVKRNNNSNNHIHYIVEIVNEKPDVEKLRMEWEKAYSRLKNRSTQGILIKNIISELEKEYEVSLNFSNYDDTYKPFFIENSIKTENIKLEKTKTAEE